MASLRCHDDYDYNKTQIMRNFHPYIIQLWKPFFHIFFHGDVIIAQAWEVSAQKIQSSHFNLPNVGEIFWVKSETTVCKCRKRKTKFMCCAHLLHKAGA